MGRKRSVSIPMEQVETLTNLIPPEHPIDPQLERVIAEDNLRKKQRRRSICITLGLTIGISVFVVLATLGVGVYFVFFSEIEGVSLLRPRKADNENQRIRTEELLRVNCYPEQDGSPFDSWHISKANCEKRGCIYKPAKINTNMPVCFIPPDSIGYRQVDIRHRHLPNEHKVTEYLLRRVTTRGIFGTLVKSVNMAVTELSDSIFRIKFTPDNDFSLSSSSSEPAFDLTEQNLLDDGPEIFDPHTGKSNKYGTEVIKTSPFSFKVFRNDTRMATNHFQELWNTDIGGLIVTGDFIQISGLVPRGARVYGVGEHRHEIFRRDNDYMAQTWSIFARNQPPDWMTETHLYGAHPFVMVVDTAGLTHGILFYNAAPSEITVNPYPQITWRSVAGIIDMYVFVGPTPDLVIQQYTQLVGRPMLPPRWFLDLHVRFSKIDTVVDLERATVEWNRKNLPLGTISVMQNDDNYRYQPFSNGLDELLAKWRTSRYNFKNLRVSYGMLPHVSILNQLVTPEDLIGRAVENAVGQLSCMLPSNSIRQTYFLYKQTTYGAKISFGYWDPLANKIIDALQRYLNSKWEITDFDAMEMLENQPYSNSRDKNVTMSHCMSYELPYTTRAGYFQYATSSSLGMSTVCALALHRDCTVPHIDIHNAYGYLLTRAVSEAWMRLKAKARRTFNKRSNSVPVMSSSTFPGFGKFGGHWLGQTSATWLSLSSSIMSILEFNWFGIPVVGDFICGEEGPGDIDLCVAWANAAAFQPVIRYDINPTRRKEFHALLNDSDYVDAVRHALTFRQHLLPYIFTQLYEFADTGVPAWKPLFHLSPSDANLANEYHTFMIGDGLLIAPILHPPKNMHAPKLRTQLVPRFRWHHLKSGRQYDMCKGASNKARIFRSYNSIRSETASDYVYLKSGSIVPVKTEALESFNISVPAETRGRKIKLIDYGALHLSLLISQDCHHRKPNILAKGTLFWEGGINDTSSIYASFTLSEYFVLEGRLTFDPPRALHSHLPPNVPRPPLLPWPFEIVIDHILFYGIENSRLFNANDSENENNNSTDSINFNELKVDVKQAVDGDMSVLTTREAIAISDEKQKILFAPRISIPLSEGDFSVVLVPKLRL